MTPTHANCPAARAEIEYNFQRQAMVTCAMVVLSQQLMVETEKHPDNDYISYPELVDRVRDLTGIDVVSRTISVACHVLSFCVKYYIKSLILFGGVIGSVSGSMDRKSVRWDE